MKNFHRFYTFFTSALLVFLTINTTVIAQTPSWKLNINGSVKDQDSQSALEGSKIEIFEGKQLIKAIFSNDKGKFTNQLEPNSNYTFKVSYKGYVSKLISVTTENVSEKVDIAENFVVSMQVNLFKNIPGVDFSLLDKPIGSVFYNRSLGKFDFDVDNIVLDKLEELEKEYQAKLQNALNEIEQAKSDSLKKLQEEKSAKKLADKEAKRADKLKAEQETFENAETKRKQKEEADLERINKAKQSAEERKKEQALKKQALIEKALAKPEHTTIVVDNIRTSESEGVNYQINHVFITFLGEEIEYKKIVYAWGGVYYKRADIDISDRTYALEMRLYGIEQHK